jgi:hypothetical protein
MSMKPKSIHGCWILKQCQLSFSDVRPSRIPFQKGMISYHPNGNMQACLSAHPRPISRHKDLEQGHLLSDEEKGICFDQFLSYSGTYTYTPTQVHHHVLLSLNPNVIGTTLTREYRFQEEDLILYYTYIARSDLSCTYTLHWKR